MFRHYKASTEDTENVNHARGETLSILRNSYSSYKGECNTLQWLKSNYVKQNDSYLKSERQ